MHYWGKVIGLILGIVSGLGFWGIMSGLLLGHLFDKLSMLKPANVSGAARSGQGLFFITTFQVMGHLTKAKGRVTEADIQLASVIMDRMQLRGEIRMAAQQAFREGKQSGYPLREKLRIFRQACHGRIDLIRIFLEIQIQAALADGKLHPSERQILYVTAEELGISRQQFDIFLEMMTGGEPFTQHHYQYRHGGTTAPQPTLQDACNVLGIRPEDDTATIKRAYRKRMNEHHPDKLVAKGLPKEMLEIAKEKAQKIQSAYDFLRQQKGFK